VSAADGGGVNAADVDLAGRGLVEYVEVPARAFVHSYGVTQWPSAPDCHCADYFTWYVVDLRRHVGSDPLCTPTACIIDSQSVKSAEKGGPVSILMGSMRAS
jgi:hypothetical protein